MKAPLILAAALWLAPSLALASSNQGLGEQSKPKDEIRVEENSVLPDAGAAGQSAAPTMKLDCQKNPSDCSKPVTSTGSTATSGKPPPGTMPQQSK
jgi:hypothetical protein